MSRVEGTCSCEEWGCTVHYKYNHKDPQEADGRLPKTGSREGWVDSVTAKCRPCEIDHGNRWGHNTAKAEESRGQVPGEANL
jgi:hypothetical protein